MSLRRQAAIREMEVFDRMHPVLRRMITVSPYNTDPVGLMDVIVQLKWDNPSMTTSEATAQVIELFPIAQEGKLQDYAADHLRRYGRPLPHVAAGATLRWEG